jgi:hypothetical protein
MRPIRSRASAALFGLTLLLACTPTVAPHELPTFPRVRLLSVIPHPWEPAVRIVTVEVTDPGGREPVTDGEVVVSGLERARGSAVRLREQWLAATPQPGTYQGAVEFPGPGMWDLTVTVRGRYLGEAHFELDVVGRGPAAASRGGEPELAFGWSGLRLLLLNWGHLLGFGLWIGVTALALVQPRFSPQATVLLTWLALAMGIGTGFSKMQYGTPFPRGLRVFDWQVPRIFFGKEYLYTLTVKHALILTAVVVTGVMTREAWRRSSAPASSRRVRVLLLGNLLLVLGVALAAAILGLLHAIVLHFA